MYDYGFEDLPLPDCSFSVSGSGLCWPIQSSNDVRELIAQMENRHFGRKLARKSVLEMNHVLHQARKHTERNNGEIGLTTTNHVSPFSPFHSSFLSFVSIYHFRIFCRFVEMGKLLEPGRLPKTDKLAVLADAVRMVTQLQCEAQKLKELNLNLQEKIKELKDEKNELCNEKQRLKLEKERLEQQMKMLCTPQPAFSLLLQPSLLHLLLEAKLQPTKWSLSSTTPVSPCGSSCHLLLSIFHRTICFALLLLKLATKSCHDYVAWVVAKWAKWLRYTVLLGFAQRLK